MFEAAAGKTHRQKVQNACIRSKCELYPTKRDEKQKEHKAFERLVSSAMQIRRERASGYPRHANLITYFEFQTVMMADQIAGQEEIGMRVAMNKILMAGFGIKSD